MSFFFPQAIITFNVRWESFDLTDSTLEKNYIFSAIAKNLTVNINSYREADTFNCMLDYKNFPFDPRCIRAIGVTIHVEDRKHLFVNETGRLDLVKPRENKYDSSGNDVIDQVTKKHGNTIFMGFADDESIDFDETNKTVKLEGRDFTALLIDAPYPGKTLDYTKPISEVIQGLLKELKSTEKIVVKNRTGVADSALPTLSQFGYDKGELSSQKSAKKDASYWDTIQDLVTQAGLIAFIELNNLVLSKPRNLYSKTNMYQFIYGQNLKSLKFNRKLGRQKGINILVRSVNLANKTEPLMTVKIPLEASDSWCTELGIKKAEQTIEKIDSEGKVQTETAPYMGFNVANIASKELLIEKGQALWEEIGRQQLEGSLSTKEMIQLQNGVEFDITKMRNGTPISIEIGKSDQTALKAIDAQTKAAKGFNDQDASVQRTKLVSARENYLVSIGYEKQVASALAKAFGKFSTEFYTKSVEFILDQENGFVMNLDFINFISVSNKGL